MASASSTVSETEGEASSSTQGQQDVVSNQPLEATDSLTDKTTGYQPVVATGAPTIEHTLPADTGPNPPNSDSVVSHSEPIGHRLTDTQSATATNCDNISSEMYSDVEYPPKESENQYYAENANDYKDNLDSSYKHSSDNSSSKQTQDAAYYERDAQQYNKPNDQYSDSNYQPYTTEYNAGEYHDSGYSNDPSDKAYTYPSDQIPPGSSAPQDTDSISRPVTYTGDRSDGSQQGKEWTGYDQKQSDYRQDSYGEYSKQYDYSQESGYNYGDSSNYNQSYSDGYGNDGNYQYPDSYDQQSRGWPNESNNQQHSAWQGYSDASYNKDGYYRDSQSYQASSDSSSGYHNIAYSRGGSSQDDYSQRGRGYHQNRAYHYDDRTPHGDYPREYSESHNQGYDSRYPNQDYVPNVDPRGSQGVSHDPRRHGAKTGDDFKPKHNTSSSKYSEAGSTFVQKRAAMLKAAEDQKVNRQSKASKGPQIVEPHRIADALPTKDKKSDKLKQPDVSFPKRNLEKFKIPKRKSAVSIPSPVKKTTPIPALDLKEPDKVTVEEKTVKVSPKASPVKAPNSATIPKKKQPAKVVTKKKTDKPRLTSTNAVVPSVLSTLDSGTLLALAATIQKTLDQAKMGSPSTTASLTALVGSMVKTKAATPTVTPTATSIVTPTATPTATSIVTPTVTPTATSIVTPTATPTATSIVKPVATTALTTAVSSTVKAKIVASSTVAALTTSGGPTVNKAKAGGSTTASLTAAVGSTLKPLNSTPITLTTKSFRSVPNSKPVSSVPMSSVITTPTIISTMSSAITSKVTPCSVKLEKIPMAPPLTKPPTEKKSSPGLVLATVVPSSFGPGSSSALPSTPASSVTSTTTTTSTLSASVKYLLSTKIFTKIDSSPATSSQIANESSSSLSSLVAALCANSPATTEITSKKPLSATNVTTNTSSQLSLNTSSEKQVTESRSILPQASMEAPNIRSADSQAVKRTRPLDDTTVDVTPIKRQKLDSLVRESNESNDTVSSKNGIAFVPGAKLTSMNSSASFLPEKEKSTPTRKRSASRSKKKVGASQPSVKSASTIVCSFCHKKDCEFNLGFLYGPYKSKVKVGNIETNVSKEKVDATATKEITNESVTVNDSLWVHEDCAVWAPGVCLVGGEVIGLQEAVTDAKKMVCVQCKEDGATLCCSTHNCKKCYHFHCAKDVGCFFKDEQFLILCPKHSSKTGVQKSVPA